MLTTRKFVSIWTFLNIVWDPKNVNSFLTEWFIVKAWWWTHGVKTCSQSIIYNVSEKPDFFSCRLRRYQQTLQLLSTHLFHRPMLEGIIESSHSTYMKTEIKWPIFTYHYTLNFDKYFPHIVIYLHNKFPANLWYFSINWSMSFFFLLRFRASALVMY